MNIPLRKYWQLLAEHIKPQRAAFALLTLLLFSSIGLQIVNPQIVRQFIDAAEGSGDQRYLVHAALAFLLISIVRQVVTIGAAYMGETVAWRATNALRVQLLSHCLHLDIGFHANNNPGTLIERIDGDVTELATFFSQIVIQVFGNLLLVTGVIIVMAFENIWIALAFLVFAAALLITLNALRSIGVPFRKATRKAEAAMYGYLEEQLNGTEDIRASGAEEYSIREYYRHQAKVLKLDMQSDARNVYLHTAVDAWMLVGNAAAILAGYTLYQRGLASVGTAYLIVNYLSMIQWPIRELTWRVESLQRVGAGIERLTDLRAITSTITDGSGAKIGDGPLPLTFENVTFAYQDNADKEQEPVLKDVSFTLEKGKVMGLLGRTGSGKSTMARLVFRLVDPQQGSVQLGELDLRELKITQVRNRVAMVTQNVQLFKASVRDNITFFDSSVNDALIKEVIDDLGLTDWYASLPDGLDTQLESGGRSLSAGESQLLAFTRVFLQDPGLVIMDEASSRLDPVTEQRIERAVDKLLQNRTAIIIAHRLGTVQRADEILILDNGEVLEHGDRLELAQDTHSHFYDLLQTGMEELLV